MSSGMSSPAELDSASPASEAITPPLAALMRDMDGHDGRVRDVAPDIQGFENQPRAMREGEDARIAFCGTTRTRIDDAARYATAVQCE